LQILPANAAIGGGTVVVGGQTVLQNGATVMAGRRPVFDALRWKHLSIVFQSAMSSLNPVMRVGVQLMEAMRLHRPDASRAMVRNRVLELFDMIGIPRDRFSAYPFELSGGMRQRVMIALALLLEPKLVIADEPTTALDVVIQHQVLREISALRERLGLSLILISHDMGAVATTCDRIAVMYAGEIVEIAPTPTIFEDSRHPYTRALIQAAPSLRGPRRLLASIPGEPISAGAAPAGCRFSPRCAFATELCRSRKPELTPLGAAHFSACHYAENLAPQKRAEAAA
jgi:peptide/nickel transport system permease protein